LSEVHLMNENLTMPETESMQEQFVSNMPTTAGQMLKKARMDAGLHIAALAVSLRVPVKRIEALENGQMDLLPDMVFVRALTSSICQTLKIDPAPILEKLPRAALPRLNRDDVAINAPIGVSNANKDSILSGFFTSPLFIGALLLCLGAAGIYLWPKASSLSQSVTELTVATKASPDVGVSQAKEVQVATENIATPSLTASAALSTAITPAQPSVATAAPIVATTANASAATTPTPAPASVPIQVPAGVTSDSLVTFKATGQTWVEVKNAKGATVFKKLLNEGESAGTSGALPLTVIVGRADVTQVEVRGKPLNLLAVSKNNVARFEVN
jgi:cytoskeleton protein RodZ